MATKIPPGQKEYQLSHFDEYSATGLTAYTISGMVITTIAVFLRFWSRKFAKVQLKSDDWTLLIAWLFTMAWGAGRCNMLYNGRAGYHALTVDPKTFATNGKVSASSHTSR